MITEPINIIRPLIFIDVGTHDGHTLEEVTQDKYDWDMIYGLEPMPEQFHNASARFQDVPNLMLFDFGLSDENGLINVYGDNSNLGSSIYADKYDVDETQITPCRMVAASEFIEDHAGEGTVIMKLNCEGAEIPIMNNLIDTGMIWKIANVMIDFDIRKVTGMEHEEQLLLDRMKEIGFDRHCFVDELPHGGSHQEFISLWLEHIGVL